MPINSTTEIALRNPCLIVVDVQVGFGDESYWGRGANSSVLDNIQALVGHFTANKLPIVIVKHNSKNPNSPLFPTSPGNELEGFLQNAGDLLVEKSVNSAFYGDPDLHQWLQDRSIETVVICGITTNHCCETTARMAGNLGYLVHFPLDATSGFDGHRLDGSVIAGSDVMQMTAANLSGEFAEVHASTAEFLTSIS